jgi:hypothetical protein
MFLTYALVILANAMSVERECLKENYYVMQDVCWTRYLPFAGTVAATVSSALSVLAGASRILQAIGHDRVFPLLGKCTITKDSKEEPRLAYFVSYAMAQILMVSNSSVNTVGPLLTNLVLLVFCLINLSCFLMSVLRIPNFRPRYPYFSALQALFGTIMCFSLMFMINWLIAIFSWMICIILFLYLALFVRPLNEWGDLGQVIYPLISRLLLKSLTQARKTGESVKHWRPSVLVLCKKVDSDSTGYLKFATNFRKGGIASLGHVLLSSDKAKALMFGPTLEKFAQDCDSHGFNFTPIMAVADHLSLGVCNLICSMDNLPVRSNTLVMGWFEPNYSNHGNDGNSNNNNALQEVKNASLSVVTLKDYEEIIACGYTMHKNTLILRNCEKMKNDEEVVAWCRGPRMNKVVEFFMETFGQVVAHDHYGAVNGYFVDVVCFVDGSSLDIEAISAALTYAHIFHSRTLYHHYTRKRVIAISRSAVPLESTRKIISEILDQLRFNFLIETVHGEPEGGTNSLAPRQLSFYQSQTFPAGFSFASCLAINNTIRSQSNNTLVTFISVPKDILSYATHLEEMKAAFVDKQPSQTFAAAFRALDVISNDLPPTAIVLTSDQKIMQMSLKD